MTNASVLSADVGALVGAGAGRSPQPIGGFGPVDLVMLDRLAEALGRRLARLHGPADGDTAPAVQPWPLSPTCVLPEMAAAVPGSVLDGVLAVAEEPEVRDALEAAGRDWTGSATIHGEILGAQVDTWLSAMPRALDDGADLVTFIDLGVARGAGDPGWDLVSVEGALRARDPRPGRPAVGHCIAAYHDAGGPGSRTPQLRCAFSLVEAWRLALSLRYPRRRSEVARIEVMVALARRHATAPMVSSRART